MESKRGNIAVIILLGLVIIAGSVIGVYTLRQTEQTKKQPVETLGPGPKSVTADYKNCFTTGTGLNGQKIPTTPTLKSVSSRCPVYFLKSLESTPTNNIFEDGSRVTIFQPGVTYVLYKNKPVYDFKVLKQSQNQESLTKNFISGEFRTVMLGNSPVRAEVVSSRFCRQKIDSTCTEFDKLLLVNLPSNYWLEVTGGRIDSYFKDNDGSRLELVQIINKDDGVNRVPPAGN